MAANEFREAATLMEGEAEGQIVTNMKERGRARLRSARGRAFTGPGHRSGVLTGSSGQSRTGPRSFFSLIESNFFSFFLGQNLC